MLSRHGYFSPLLLLFLCVACTGPVYHSRVLDAPQYQGLKGHQKPYVVNGVRYDPLLSCEGFVEEGVASWYGPDFHGKKTSNGETYDMYAMTAAHKTLPLGASVKVVNQRNGLETVVRVNDRGPFVAGRIIDLSYAAAKKLDVVGPGTAPVRIETLGGHGGAARESAKRDLELVYTVQIGAFSSRDNAERLAATLRPESGEAVVVEAQVEKRLFYRVWAGRYPTQDGAEQARQRFKTKGYGSGFVVVLD
ncbi:MAG: septal ring lytic transglycosylase RlpA family lipoprotein [Desulfuromonas sp.]|nr:MAG: septal ring lytic transglycosylase RlpA family lipoprotein [Desulfuromonas sp.]